MLYEKIGLGEILRRYQLIVPPNQREYSWKTEHVKTLFQDLARAINDDDTSYFLGTVVGVERAGSPGVIEVVDGQQRLATTVIFLCEMKKYLSTKDPFLSESLIQFLTDIDRTKREKISKMQLNVADNEFFKSMITSESPINATKPSHRLIENSFEISRQQIRHIVKLFNEKDHGDVLNKWLTFIEHNAIVILLTVDNSVNAYKMFETLNDRGLKTSQADLVKNYLFGQSGPRLSEAQNKWSLMRGALETGYEDDITVEFLRHVLIALRGHTKQQEVFEVTEKIAKGSNRALTLLDTLEKLSNTYVAITNPTSERWNRYPDSLRRAIGTLNLLNIKPFYPILLSIAERFDPKEATKAMEKMISLGVRLFIASRTTTGNVEEALASAAHNIYDGKTVDSKGLIKDIFAIIPNDEDFKKSFEQATVSKAALARYYLRALEMATKREPTPWFIPNDDKETITLEHVLPLKPENNWPDFTPDEAETYCKRLGNMVLLIAKSNSDLRSASFAIKKKVYKDSAYTLTSQISNPDIENWTKEVILRRQVLLAEYALEAWPI